MKFTKMHGAGNDFIIINNIEEKIPVEKLNQIAKTLCQRRLSLGANGLMVVDNPCYGGDYKTRFYNPDGSEAEMCGNGARCIARYGYEKKLAGETPKIETKAGMVTGWRQDSHQYKIRLNNPSLIKLEYNLEVDGKKYVCSYLELGNPGIPHGVVKIDGLKDMKEKDLWDLGNKLRYHKEFQKGANINFYEVVGIDEVLEKTFERGVEDFTLACGTGTGSTVAVLTLLGKVSGEHVKVHVPGGELYITIVRDKDQIKEIYLTGPTNIVAEGEITD
ncbi:MAG: diaminopimelate epimerase [Clostridium sp.]|jgi:diaminopimelate epimerase